MIFFFVSSLKLCKLIFKLFHVYILFWPHWVQFKRNFWCTQRRRKVNECMIEKDIPNFEGFLWLKKLRRNSPEKDVIKSKRNSWLKLISIFETGVFHRLRRTSSVVKNTVFTTYGHDLINVHSSLNFQSSRKTFHSIQAVNM